MIGKLDDFREQRQGDIRRGISERNAAFYEAEAEKLDGWADDLKLGLEREIKEFDRPIKDARRAAATALTLEEKLAGQKQIKALEAQRNEKRRLAFRGAGQGGPKARRTDRNHRRKASTEGRYPRFVLYMLEIELTLGVNRFGAPLH